MHIKVVTLAVLLASGVTGPAWAQAPDAVPPAHEQLGGLIENVAGPAQSPGDQGRGHFGGPPPGPERALISLMLGRRDELALSPAQVQALERLRGDFQKDAVRRDAEIRATEAEVASLLAAEPVDLAKVESKVREAERLRTELRLARIRTIEEGKAQLTPEQRGKLAQLAAEPGRPSARPPRPMGPGQAPGRPERM